MKRRTRWVLLGATLVAVAGLLLLGTCRVIEAGTPIPLSTVRACGGIAPGSVIRNPNGSVALQLRCDLSGLETITTKPTQINGLGGVGRIDYAITGSDVVITIRRSLTGSAIPRPVNLGALSPGTYRVIYRDPDGTEVLIGTANVP